MGQAKACSGYRPESLELNNSSEVEAIWLPSEKTFRY